MLPIIFVIYLIVFFSLELNKDQINVEEKYPTDRGLFDENINDNLKRSILDPVNQ